MRTHRQLVHGVVALIGALVVLTGCTYDAAIRRMSLAEQSEFYIYRKVMTGAQEHKYLAKATAAERTAYLSEIGLAQRFQALDPLDREAVQYGWPRVGMSADALRFVWGNPDYTNGDARLYAQWYYYGSSFGRGNSNSIYTGFGSRVDVTLADGKVVAWVDVVPSLSDGAGDTIRQ